MQGQTERLLESEPVAGAAEYRMLTDRLVPLRDPVGEDIRLDGTAGYPFVDDETPNWHADQALGSSVYGRTTLVPAFCRAYLRETGGRAVAVHAAKGATCVREWLPGTASGEMLRKKTGMAAERIRETDTVGRRYLIWLQGESDAIEGTTRAAYKDLMRALASSLRRDVGIDVFGILRVGRFTYDDRDLEILDAQSELCREEEGFLLLTDLAEEMSMDHAWTRFQEAPGHFTAEGLVRLGTEAGRTLGLYRAGRMERRI